MDSAYLLSWIIYDTYLSKYLIKNMPNGPNLIWMFSIVLYCCNDVTKKNFLLKGNSEKLDKFHLQLFQANTVNIILIFLNLWWDKRNKDLHKISSLIFHPAHTPAKSDHLYKTWDDQENSYLNFLLISITFGVKFDKNAQCEV